MDPAKDADGLHPTNLGRLVLGEAGAAAVHAARHRGAAAPLRRPDRRRRGRRGRPRRHRRAAARPAAHPAHRERDRDAVPHRDRATSPRTPAPGRHRRRGGGRARAGDRRTWSGRAPPCSTSASPAPTPAWSATSHPDVREVAGYLAPMPGGVGPDDPGDAAAQRGRGAERRRRSARREPRRGRRRPAADPRWLGRPAVAAAARAGRRRASVSRSSRWTTSAAAASVLGVSVLFAALARLVLPVRRVGLLVVRSRAFDVLVLVTMGVVAGRARDHRAASAAEPVADPRRRALDVLG